MIWWLSFADAAGFRGACCVEAAGDEPHEIDASFRAAITKANELGINPGGEVKGAALGGATPAALAEGGLELNRLYSKAELEAIGDGVMKF